MYLYKTALLSSDHHIGFTHLTLGLSNTLLIILHTILEVYEHLEDQAKYHDDISSINNLFESYRFSSPTFLSITHKLKFTG